MCTELPIPCARQRFRMWLAVLQLRHGRRNGDAAPELAAGVGSDPPFWDASIGIVEGSLPLLQSARKSLILLGQRLMGYLTMPPELPQTP